MRPSGSPDQIKTRIQEVTAPLLGRSLWTCTRAADMAAFQFGAKRQTTDFLSKPLEVGEYALHVQCAWRITTNEQVLVGNADLYYPPDLTIENTPPEYDWDRGPNRRDELLARFFKHGTLDFVVKRIDVGNAGALFIVMNDGLSLELFPNDSLTNEHWRLFKPRSNEPHFVFSGKGISED